MKGLLMAVLGTFAIGTASLAPALAQDKPGTILVLDASGSMWGQIDGVNKIVIAREVVSGILADFPADEPLGFVTYGHRERGQCSDIQTVIEPAPGTANEIVRIVDGLNPRGMTPMTDAVIAAAQSLRHTEQVATVILVSDGIETCNPDPCAAARELERAGIDFTAHVIGFDVRGEAEALLQMQCIASETGGRFLTADNAQELTEALQQVVAAPAALPSSTELTLRAVMDGEDGPLVETPITWTFSLDGESFEVEGNPGLIELPPGPWEVTGYHVALEQEQSAQLAIVGRQPRTHSMVFETPVPTASLVAPDSAAAGKVIEIGWNGPDEPSDNIQIAHVGGRYIDFAYTRDGNPLRLQMPAEPGNYELRYSLRDRQVIHTRPIEITPIELDIIAPTTASAGSVTEIGWVGPAASDDNIQIGPEGGRYLHYAYVRDGNPLRLQMPIEPGMYELRYSFQDREVIHTRPIEITPVDLNIIAPETASAGSVIEIGWVGPAASDDNIQIGPEGGRYLHYAYVRDGNPLRLQMPIEPGTYELRYSFRDREVIHTRPIEIAPIDLNIVAPKTAPAGAVIEIGWVGPAASYDNIQIGREGGRYLHYAYVRDGNPVRLQMPSEPGTYELRYSFRDREVVFTRTITVTE